MTKDSSKNDDMSAKICFMSAKNENARKEMKIVCIFFNEDRDLTRSFFIAFYCANIEDQRILSYQHLVGLEYAKASDLQRIIVRSKLIQKDDG